MKQKSVLAAGLVLCLPLSVAYAVPADRLDSDGRPVQQVALEWDDIEDGAEDIGSSIERQWEKVEDGLFGEDAEERAEEAEERREDRLEEIEEERAKGN